MATQTSRPFYLGGEARQGSRSLRVQAPDTGTRLAEIARPEMADLAAAIAAADRARPTLQAETSRERRQRLLGIVAALEQRHEEFARCIASEAGKPIRFARAEVDRAIYTFQLAAEECARPTEESLRLDGFPNGAGRLGWVRRFPIGVCTFVTPFNFPLNLGAHKVAPALAAGCPFVWKPAEKTPLTALLLAEVLQAVQPALPPGSWSVLPALPEDCDPLTTDPRVRHFSFTGSAAVGWRLKSQAERAQVTLELGGNAAALIAEDWELPSALDSCALSAFAYSGQVCLSLQRLFVPEARLVEAIEGMAARASRLQRGPVLDAGTEIGPLIDEAAAERVEAWIRSACAGGAKLHCGGTREGSFVAPSVLSGVPMTQPLWCQEVFGPVVVIEPYRDYEEALAQIDDSDYGLQAAVFTRDWGRIRQAWERLEVGQLIVGDATVFRVDDMPYGGVKASGIGREGLRYAIEAMTEPRLLVL